MLESVKEIFEHASGSQLSNRMRNCQEIELVSIPKISCTSGEKLGNLPRQSGNCMTEFPTYINRNFKEF